MANELTLFDNKGAVPAHIAGFYKEHSNVEERAWDIVVKNLHDAAIPVTVLDQLPFSANENVVITPMAQMTPPTEKDLNKRRGVMAWRFDLAPKAENTIKFGYKVAWPENMQVGMNIE